MPLKQQQAKCVDAQHADAQAESVERARRTEPPGRHVRVPSCVLQCRHAQEIFEAVVKHWRGAATRRRCCTAHRSRASAARRWALSSAGLHRHYYQRTTCRMEHGAFFPSTIGQRRQQQQEIAPTPEEAVGSIVRAAYRRRPRVQNVDYLPTHNFSFTEATSVVEMPGLV